MADTCPTVRIKWDNPAGYAELDESAFDPKVHELLDAPSKPARKLDGEPKAPVDAALGDLRKQYRAKFGKNAGPKWTAEQISAKLAE